MPNVKTDAGLKMLKSAVLGVLHKAQDPPLTSADISLRLEIPLVKDHEGSKTTLVRGILAHLSAEGHAEYNTQYKGWQITEEGISVLKGS